MLTLAIETATDTSSVVVTEEGEELAGWRQVTRQDLCRRLAGEVGRVLEAATRTFHDLDLVCVGLGPGSFTSLRVGLATAKGLCLARHLPLVGIPSLAAMAWQMRHLVTGLACPVLDARRGEVYAGLFRARDDRVERAQEEFVADAVGLADRLRATCEPVTVFGQTDLVPLATIEAALEGKATLLREPPVVPDAAAIAHLGKGRFREHGADDLSSLHPIYVRKSYAEEKFDLDLGLR